MEEPPFFTPARTTSTSWQDSAGIHLRVYTSNGYTVSERCFESGTWSTGAFSQRGGDVSSTAWVDSDGTYHIRVYCIAENTTTEWCDDGNGEWYKGAFSYG